MKMYLSRLILGSLLALNLTACADYALPGTVAPLALSQNGPLALGTFDQQLGQNMVSYALSHVSGGTGYCYQYVAESIHSSLPPFLSGLHAYLAADQLALSPYFKEVAVAPSQLGLLPAGAVVVWGQGSSESGHISIADGQGREISDHVQIQMASHYGGGSARVFLPVNPVQGLASSAVMGP